MIDQSQHRGSPLRRLMLPLGILIAMFIACVPAAHAVEEHHYGGVLLQPGAKLKAPEEGLNMMTGNIAGYLGSGEIKVCQSVYDWNRSVTSRTCGINGSGNALNQFSWWGNSMSAFIENASGNAHTIHGWWYSMYDRLGYFWGRRGGLTSGTRIESPNFKYSFRMQSDGNAVVYNNQTLKACWATNTQGYPGAYADQQDDGNFVVYRPGHVPVFASNTAGNNGGQMLMQDDGNLVIYNTNWQPVWATSWITGQLGC